MFNLLRKYKGTLIGLALILGGFVAYQLYFSGGEGSSLLKSQSGADIRGSVVGREIIILLDELQNINLDDSILDDPAFQSLIDFEQEVRTEPVGRNNPFVPIDSQ